MAKSIKKIIKYISIILGIIVLIPVLLYLALRIPTVQTYLINKITGNFSPEFRTSISVGKMEYKFFDRLRLDDVLIRDQNSDTLIYSKIVTIGFQKLDLSRKTVTLGRVTLLNPVVNFTTDTAGLLNLTWYLEKLKSKNPSKKNKITFKINHADLSNGRFSYSNQTAPDTPADVDLSDLRLSGINGILEDFIVSDDTSKFSIYHLAFIDHSGLRVERFSADATFSNNFIKFSNSQISTEKSVLNISNVILAGDSIKGFTDIINDVKLNIVIDKSVVSLADLAKFSVKLPNAEEKVNISGRISGTFSELRVRDLSLAYGSYSSLECDFDISGLPKIENSFIYLGISSLKTNAKDFENLNIPGLKKLILPEIIHNIGTVAFEGSFTGFTTDFVAYGELRSTLGSLNTDISLRPDGSGLFRIKGLVKGNGIALGKLTGESDLLGDISMSANIDGSAYSFSDFSGNIRGLVDSVEVNDYKYRNIDLNGSFTERTWDGSIKINEENIITELQGILNFNNEKPEFDFTLNIEKANLFNLKIDKADTTSSLSLLATANFSGNNIDNLDGEINLVNSTLNKYGDSLDLKDFRLRTFRENGMPAIDIRTDFADINLRGEYNFAALAESLKQTLFFLMPSLYAVAPVKIKTQPNNFNFTITLKNTDRLNTFFKTGFLISSNSQFKGTIITDNLATISGVASTLTYRNNVFKDLNFTATAVDSVFSANIQSSSLNILGQSELKAFKVGFTTEPDNFIFSVNWDNEEEIQNKGNFVSRGIITRVSSGAGKPSLSVLIDSSSVWVKNNRWKISESNITLDSTTLIINNLRVNSDARFYGVNGKISENPKDTLYLQFNDIDISPLNYLLISKMETESIDLNLKGKLNGKFSLSDLYRNPLIETSLMIRDFSILNSSLGDLSLTSIWNNKRKVAEIVASNNLDGKELLSVSGYYDPGLRKIQLSGNADGVPVEALNPLLSSFASEITGSASGKINLTGEAGKMVLKGSLFAENTSMKVDYLQVKYKLNDSIRFSENAIIFRNIALTDERGNSASLNGRVTHNYFKDFGADISLNTNGAMVLNTRQKDNEMFYGTAFSSGLTTIRSVNNDLIFDISASTSGDSRLFIPLNSSETVTDFSFISFVSNDTTEIKNRSKTASSTLPAAIGLDINIDLEITPEAEVQLIFDSKIGDVMRGRGSGNLNIVYNSRGDFRIAGTYTIDNGDYLFTLGNVFNKPFSVESGGRIIFNGNIDDAEIDIKAIYKTKASLYEILQDERFSERIPVECQINLSGKLFNPVVGFNIYLPLADEESRTLLRNAITTEEELSRQFLYLLVMNRFYADPSFGSSLSASTTTTGTEMLSNQLSNWLSQISNDFDIGFMYRPGYKDINAQEVEVALSTQLLNDRVVINSNLGVRGSDAVADKTSQITGDFDVEYKLTEKIRFKFFNRFNNPYTGRQSDYTQGFGLLFRQEFDKFSDLFRRKQKKEMKREEEITPEPPVE